MEFLQPTLSNLKTIKAGDTVKFKILIAFRPHSGKSKVYKVEGNKLFISCNGIRKEFELRLSEVTGIAKQ